MPCSFLLDANGAIVKVYQGNIRAQQFVKDATNFRSTLQSVCEQPFPSQGYS